MDSFKTHFNTYPVTMGPAAQSVASLIADPAVASFIPARSHTFVEIIHEIFSTVILLLHYFKRGCYKRKFMCKVLVNCLVKLVQEKVWLGDLTVST